MKMEFNTMSIFALFRNLLIYEIFGVQMTLVIRYVLGVKEIMTEFSIIFIVSLGFIGSVFALQLLQKICSRGPNWLQIDSSVTENCFRGSDSEWPPFPHMACAGIVLCFSRMFECGSLRHGPVIENQAMWALMPFFYIIASMIWKDFDYKYNKRTIGILVLVFFGVSLVSIENPDVNMPSMMYGLGWIICKSQLIVYLDYIRMKLGAHPNSTYVYTNIVSGVGSLFMYWIYGAERFRSLTIEIMLLGILLFVIAMLYGMYFLFYDAPALRVCESQSIPYRSTIRMGIAVLIASILFPQRSAIYNYIGFAIVFIGANLHKFIQIRVEEYGEQLIDEESLINEDSHDNTEEIPKDEKIDVTELVDTNFE